LIALLPAKQRPNSLLDPSTPLATDGTLGAAPSPPLLLDRYLVPIGIVTLVFLGFSLMLAIGGWLRGLPLGMVLASGGSIFAVTIAVAYPRRAERGAVAPTPPAPIAHVESAFVCSACSEYTAPPDWEALLRETGPSDDVPANRPASLGFSPFVPPTNAWASALPTVGFGRTPAGELIAGPETVYIPPPASYALSELFEDGPVELHQGRLVPLPAPNLSRSGGWRSAAPIGPGRTGRAPATPATDAIVAPSVPGLPVRTDPPTLDLWILSEVDGIVARSTSVGDPLDALLNVAREIETEHGGVRGASTCAACREDVAQTGIAHQCTDCLRPICTPCRGRVVRHDGAAWCGPCAVNRLSAQFIASVAPSTEPAPEASGAVAAVGPMPSDLEA